jgi:hypothetical protein
VAYENTAYKTGIPIANSNFANQRFHHPFKVPLNQRANSISIRFSTVNPYTEYTASPVYSQLEISDLRLLWTYTDRSRTHKTLTAANAGKNL